MNTNDFTTTFSTDKSPQVVFVAINNVRGWWSEEIVGHTDKLNAEFWYHFQDLHRCHIKIVEFVPDKRVVWQVLENYFKFTKDKAEWTGTRIIFEITKKGSQTEIHFTHQGLVPQYECYNICKDAWTNYLQNSLRSLITTGKGMPNATGKPQTENERKLGAVKN
ncbi:MAG: SRPBCC domain-containing protein [Mucilaginibacter sp.]